MKKSIFILVIGLMSLNMSFAQTQDGNNLSKEFDLLLGELENTMRQFEGLVDGINQLDTLDLNAFGFDIERLEKSLEGKDMDNLSIDDMMDLMKLQMEMMEDIDLNEINKLFEGLGFTPPNMNTPRSNPEDGTEPAKKKKKRKTYKL